MPAGFDKFDLWNHAGEIGSVCFALSARYRVAGRTTVLLKALLVTLCNFVSNVKCNVEKCAFSLVRFCSCRNEVLLRATSSEQLATVCTEEAWGNWQPAHRGRRSDVQYVLAITKTSGNLGRNQQRKGPWDRLEGQDKKKNPAPLRFVAVCCQVHSNCTAVAFLLGIFV